MIYFFSIFLILVLWLIYTVFYQKKARYQNFDEQVEQGNTYGERQTWCVTIVFIYLFLVVALRSVNIGWDTYQYQRSYTIVGGLSSLQDLLAYKLSGGSTMEWGFLFLEWVCSKFMPFQLFLALCAFTYLYPVSRYILKYSDNKLSSTFLFVSFGHYIFCISTIRQSMAMGLAVIAIMCAHEHKYIKTVIIVVAAVLLHRTALTIVPALFYDKIKLNRKTIIAIIVAMILVYWRRASILTFLVGYAREQQREMETGGMLLYLFVLMIVVIGAFNWKELSKNRLNVFLFICQCFVIIIFPVLRVNPTYFRVYYFNYLFMIVYIPNMLSCIKDRTIRKIIKIGIYCVAMYYFTNAILHTNNPILPYTFYWQV